MNVVAFCEISKLLLNVDLILNIAESSLPWHGRRACTYEWHYRVINRAYLCRRPPAPRPANGSARHRRPLHWRRSDGHGQGHTGGDIETDRHRHRDTPVDRMGRLTRRQRTAASVKKVGRVGWEQAGRIFPTDKFPTAKWLLKVSSTF